MGLNRVIALRGEPIVDEQNTASVAVTPGELIEISSGQWQPHGSAAGLAGRVFALERDEAGDDIDTDYAVDDRVKAGYFAQGDRVNAWLASGEDVAEGAFLNSAGGGLLQAGTTNAIAQAAEAVDAASGDARITAIII